MKKKESINDQRERIIEIITMIKTIKHEDDRNNRKYKIELN